MGDEEASVRVIAKHYPFAAETSPRSANNQRNNNNNPTRAGLKTAKPYLSNAIVVRLKAYSIWKRRGTENIYVYGALRNVSRKMSLIRSIYSREGASLIGFTVLVLLLYVAAKQSDSMRLN